MGDPVPLFQNIASSDFLEFSFGARSYSAQLANSVAKTGEVSAVQVDVRTLRSEREDGSSYSAQVVFITHDFRFMGGSLGCAEGEKIVLGFEHGQANGLPVVLLCQSGGARMQEGTLSLMQMAKVSVAVRKHSDMALPFLTLLVDPTYGGVSASYAMQADVRIGVKGARVGFAGPAVILNTMYEMDQAAFDKECPDNFQTAEYLLENGQIDLVVEPEAQKGAFGAQLEAAVCGCLQVLSAGGSRTAATAAAAAVSAPAAAAAATATTCAMDHNLARSIDRTQPRDIIAALSSHYVALLGDGKQAADSCMCGGLALLPGAAADGGAERVVVIFNTKGHTPAEMAAANYGMAAPSGYRTALRLMKLAERFSLPVVTFVDTCGAWPSFPAEQAGQSEAIATNLTAMAGLTVPIVTVVTGEGGSGGALGIGE